MMETETVETIDLLIDYIESVLAERETESVETLTDNWS